MCLATLFNFKIYYKTHLFGPPLLVYLAHLVAFYTSIIVDTFVAYTTLFITSIQPKITIILEHFFNVAPFYAALLDYFGFDAKILE